MEKELQEKIDAARVKKFKSSFPFREHLGCSQIGESCERKLWYNFRWTKKPDHSARILRLFETGELAEDRISRDLKRAGIEVIQIDNRTGTQFRFSEIDGHFGGSMDCVIKYQGNWFVGEFKTHNEKSFKDLLKKELEESKPVHFAQVQIYMALAKIPRAMYIAVNKNTDEMYIETVDHDPNLSAALLDKAERIIRSNIALDKISNRKSWFECKWCDYSETCHGEDIPDVNCRTCAFGIVQDNWICVLNNDKPCILSKEDQKNGCKEHCFKPAILPKNFDFLESNQEVGNNFFKYKIGKKEVINGLPGIQSKELHINEEILNDKNVKKVKEVFPESTISIEP